MSHAKFVILVALFSLMTGCVGLTDQQKFEQKDRYVVAFEKYQIEEVSCNRSGGVMMNKRWRASRIKHRPTLFELRTAECVNSQGILDDIRRQSR